jgi:hypothetical protein
LDINQGVKIVDKYIFKGTNLALVSKYTGIILLEILEKYISKYMEFNFSSLLNLCPDIAL